MSSQFACSFISPFIYFPAEIQGAISKGLSPTLLENVQNDGGMGNDADSDGGEEEEEYEGGVVGAPSPLPSYTPSAPRGPTEHNSSVRHPDQVPVPFIPASAFEFLFSSLNDLWC